MKKLRITSSTLESAGSRFHRSRYRGSANAKPANSRLGCRIGHSSKYITSGLCGHVFLFAMNGKRKAMAFEIFRPSGSVKVHRLSVDVDRIWQIAVIASRLKSEYPYGFVRRSSSGK